MGKTFVCRVKNCCQRGLRLYQRPRVSGKRRLPGDFRRARKLLDSEIVGKFSSSPLPDFRAGTLNRFQTHELQNGAGMNSRCFNCAIGEACRQALDDESILKVHPHLRHLFPRQSVTQGQMPYGN